MLLLKVVLFCFSACDSLREVAAFSILHNDFELVILCDVDLTKVDNIGMVQVLQDLGFFDSFFFLFGGHVLNIHFLNNELLVGVLVLHKVGLPESSLAQQLFSGVNLVLAFNHFDFHHC